MECSVLVFPSGTEIGLEIERCLRRKKGIQLFGASSAEDMSQVVYDEVFFLPFLDDVGIKSAVEELVRRVKPDFLIPAHDDAVTLFSEMEEKGLLGATRVIGSPSETCRIVRSKSETYRCLSDAIEVPIVIYAESDIQRRGLRFPLFSKPDIGQGSKGTRILRNSQEFCDAMSRGELICEYLPGEEYTVDCYSGLDGRLRFIGPRRRDVRSNGISVQTSIVEVEEFESMAASINSVLHFAGPWFFQVKRRASGQLVILEVAARIGGSSGIHRYNGINFILTALYEWSGYSIKIKSRRQVVSSVRGLSEHYVSFGSVDGVLFDLDDTLVRNGLINWTLIGIAGELWNRGLWLEILTRHGSRFNESALDFMEELGFPIMLFRAVHDIGEDELKSSYVPNGKVVFVDDSWSERREVMLNSNAIVLDLEECISLKNCSSN